MYRTKIQQAAKFTNLFSSPSKTSKRFIFTSLIISTLALSPSHVLLAQEKAKAETTKSDSLPEDFAKTTSKYGSYLAARIASIDHDATTSTQLFERALKFNPENRELLRNLFLAKMANGQFEEAIELAKKIISHPQMKLANDLLMVRDHRDDKNEILKILKPLNAEEVDRYLQGIMDVREYKIALINPIVFAIIATNNGDAEKAQAKAIEELNKIEDDDFERLYIAIQEDRPFISEFALAVDAIKARSYDSAINHLKSSLIQGHLDRMMGTILTVWSLAGQKKFDEALKLLDGLKGPVWYAPFVSLHKGHILNLQGKSKEAQVIFKQAVDNPDGAEIADQAYGAAIMALAKSFAREEKWDDALVTVDTGLGRYGAFAPMVALRDTIKAKGKIPLEVNNPQEGAALLLLNVSTAIDRDENTEIAQIYMQMSRALALNNSEILMELAEHFDREGAIEQANQYYHEVSETSPFYRIAQLEIALNFDQMGQLEKSQDLFKKLVGEKPTDLIAYMAWGGTLSRHEKYQDAAEIYDMAVKNLPNRNRFHWNLYYRRGIAFERTKQWPKAEKNFKIALELYPDHPDVLNYLGYTWIDMGINLDKGLEMIKKAANQRPNSGYIVDSLGWAYYKLGIFGKAVFYLEKALELEPADPTINDHLGDAYWHVNRKTEAGFQWNRALILKPDDALRSQIEMKLKKGLDAVESKPEAEKAPEKNNDQEKQKKI